MTAEHDKNCVYLGADIWDCGHIDNAESQCDCECCQRGVPGEDDKHDSPMTLPKLSQKERLQFKEQGKLK